MKIEITHNGHRPYRVEYCGREFTRTEIISYLTTIATVSPTPEAILICPIDKGSDLNHRQSAPVIDFARRRKMPVVYLDAPTNALDPLILSLGAGRKGSMTVRD